MHCELSNADVLEYTVKSISSVINSFQKNTYSFLYESDIQAMIFAKARGCLPQTIKINGTGNPLHKYEIPIVNTEYYKKIDIVCLDVSASNSREAKTHKGLDMGMYDLPIQIGVEIKYRKQGDCFTYNKCENDLEKLRKMNVKIPIIIGFIQNKESVDDFFCNFRGSRTPIDLSLLSSYITKGSIIISSDDVWYVPHEEICYHSQNSDEAPRKI